MANARPEISPDVGGLHGLDLSANHHFRAARQVLAAVVDDLLDVVGHAAQIAPLHRSVNIDDRLNVVVRDQRHSRRRAGWLPASPELPDLRRSGPGNRDVLKVLQRIQPVLRRLGRDGIAHAILGIQPVGRRSLETAAERNQQVGGNVALRESGQLGLGPVHIDVQMRFIEGLLNAQVRRSRNHLDPSQQLDWQTADSPARYTQ